MLIPFLKRAIFVGLLLLAGLSQAANEVGQTVRIGTYAFIDGGKVSILGNPLIARVIEEGWLEQELAKRNVKLEWFPVMGDTGSITNEAFAAGRIDFANYGDLPSVTLNAGGIRTEVIVPSGRGTDMYLLVPPGSTAQSIQDLKGKRISVHRGRPWELGFRKLIDSAGLKASDFKIFNLNPQAGAAALASGNVDAHFAMSGYILEEKGVGRVIWSTHGKPLRLKMRAELWGSRPYAEKNPEITQVIATAYVRASYWLAQEQNREAAIKIGTRNGTSESSIRKGYEDETLSWKDRWSPLVDDIVAEHYRDVVAFAKEQKLIRSNLNPQELYTDRFVKKALIDLGLQNYWTPWRKGTESSQKPVSNRKK